MSGLNCIVNISSNVLLDNSIFVDRREFGQTTTMMGFFLWLDFLNDLSHSRLPYASLRCNLPARNMRRSKKEDIIPLNSRKMFYSENEKIYW